MIQCMGIGNQYCGPPYHGQLTDGRGPGPRADPGRVLEEIVVPTYQYACTECGHAFEQFQSFSDDALTTCPECEGRLRKLFNAVGVVFKGSGFYETDYRSKAYKKSAEEDRKAETKSKESSSDKKESESKKPAAKAEKKPTPKPDKGSSKD